MKITDVEAIVLDTGSDYPDPSAAVEAHGVRFVCLIKVSTDEGITGWSDVETQPHVAKAVMEAPSGGQIGFESARAALIGEDPLERERLAAKMYRYMGYYGRRGPGCHVASGVDVALWDIAGKRFGQPVHKLLGASYRDRVRAYASTLFRPTEDAMRRATAEYMQQGFTAVKFGWGVFGRDVDLDLRLVAAARREAGTAVDIMVDAGWYGTGYDDPFRGRAIKDWIRLAQGLEDLGVVWLEDFLPPDNVSGYAEVSRAVQRLRIAAGEQCESFADFQRLAGEGCVHVLQPDLSRCGGLTVAKRVADLAEDRGIDCVPHAWLTDVLKAASLHLSAAMPRSLFLECNTSTGSLLTRLCGRGIPMKDGYLSVPQGPGLGVTLDEDVVARFRVA
jgi:L-rhamnonate dehydratase